MKITIHYNPPAEEARFIDLANAIRVVADDVKALAFRRRLSHLDLRDAYPRIRWEIEDPLLPAPEPVDPGC